MQYKLAPIFALVPSSLSVWIDYELEVITSIIEFNLNSDLRVEWPSAAEMMKYAQQLKKHRPNGPIMSNIFGLRDVGRLSCAYFVNTDV